MPLPKRQLVRSLRRKFHFEDVPGTRHDALSLFVGGTKVATTRFSRSGREIGDGLLKQIAGQLRVDLQTLKAMHDCSVSREDYLRLLGDEGFLS